jgi:hypothetical protein
MMASLFVAGRQDCGETQSSATSSAPGNQSGCKGQVRTGQSQQSWFLRGVYPLKLPPDCRLFCIVAQKAEGHDTQLFRPIDR